MNVSKQRIGGIPFPASLAVPGGKPRTAGFLRAGAAAVCALLLAAATANAAPLGPLQTEEIFGWLFLAVAPVLVFAVWWLTLWIRRYRRVQLLGLGLDSCGDAMALINERHVYVAVNDAYGRMLDIPPERIAGKHVSEIWGRDIHEQIIRPNLNRCFAGETVYGRAVVPLPSMKGRYIEVVYNPVVRNGQVRYASAFLLDATRRVKAETALRERENIYSTLVEGANSVILRVNPEGRINFINSYGLAFFGYTQEEIQDRHLLGLILPETDSEGRNLRRMWSDVLADIDKFALNKNENIKKSGERVWMLWSNRALRDENGKISEVLCIGNDITPLEKSRREMEGLREALNQSGNGMAVTELDGRIRFTNPAWDAMHGLEPDGLEPMENIGESFDPMAEGLRLAEMLGQVRTKGGVQAEMLHLRSDMSSFTALTTMTLMRDPAGNPDGLVFMAVDTSEHIRLKADLDKNRQRLKVIVDNIADIVFSLDPSGRFIYMSPAVREMFGYEPSEAEGRHFSLLTHPDDVEACERSLEQLRRGEESPLKLELRGCRKDGAVIWLVVGFSGIVDQDGKLTQVVGVVRDMTERRRMTEELQESRERFRELVKAIEEAYWLHDGQGLIYASPGFQPIFGLSGESLHTDPKRLLEVIHPEDRPIADSLWNGKRSLWAFQDVTLRVLDPEQGVRWVRARTFPVVRDGVVVRTAGVAQDVTAYTEAVNTIREARDAAERANHVKSEFLSRMGHEFRTPLNGILGMLQLLEIGGRLDKDDAGRAAEAAHSARTLQGLLDRLLEYVDLEDCESNLQNMPFSVRDLLRGLESAYAPLAEEKNLELRIDHGSTLKDVEGDAGMIRRILNQLMDNAIKFTEEGTVAVLVSQEPEPGKTGIVRTTFRVEDSGPGIPKESRTSVFDPFVQADGSYTRRHGGAGLGLGIARQISRCIGGELLVDESPLGGAAVELIVSLPKA
ncbi:PAS domain-containing sensor histidine kinase [Paucidesulfovibrio longus]|uniref:PAS domain-containing sensor histidine kinase n=1 Tax=Paucidesulfovibrio longus TaxID=889 RepID=UPI0003B798DB|nr:PAS domain-containing sensor histidine kinase [Paucidesulfovibrio longus]